MLTQGHAPDPKSKLDISSFLTLRYLSDCPICTRNYMSIILLLQMMGGWDEWGWLIDNGVWEGGQGVGIILYFLFFLFSLVLLSFVLSCPMSFF